MVDGVKEGERCGWDEEWMRFCIVLDGICRGRLVRMYEVRKISWGWT